MPRKSSRCKERIRSVTAVTLAFLIVFCAATFPTAASAALQGDSWETLARMHVGRYGFGAASVGGKIYAISGGNVLRIYDTNEVYDVATDSWTMKQPIPTGRSGFAIAAVRSRIYCIGGYRERPLNSMEIYDTVTDTWVTGASMPRAREYPSASVVDEKIYVIGGQYGRYSPSDDNEMYDPQTGAWITKSPMPNPISAHVSAVIDNKIYLFSDQLTQIYDTETDTWSKGPSPPIPGGSAAGAATTGTYTPKRIYVIYKGSNWVFDPQTSSWSTAASPEDPAQIAGVAVVNDQVYLIGGLSPSYAQLDVCQRYTPAGYHSAPLPSLSVSVLSPGGGQSGLYGDVNLVFTVNRENLDIANVSYRLDGQAAVPVQGNVTIEGLSVGSHSLSVKVTDVLENSVTTQTVTFAVGKSETFPIVWVAVAVIGLAAGVSFGLVAYFLRRKKRRPA